eukprot:scaffold14267_cov55-Phaeocystis_antarctica.AAC.3
MTPEPGRLHTRSKSILMATQLVMPPAKPKRPAASTHRAMACPNVSGSAGHACSAFVAAVIIMPSSITLNVARLLMLPLFRYGMSISCTPAGDQSGGAMLCPPCSGMSELVCMPDLVCGDLASASESPCSRCSASALRRPIFASSDPSEAETLAACTIIVAEEAPVLA